MATAATSGGGGALPERLLGEMAAADTRIAAAAGTLTLQQLQWRPPEGGWGVGDVLEHLVVSNADYLRVLRVLVGEHDRNAGAARRAAPGSGPDRWRPSLMGGFLARSLRARRKLPAPRAWRPVVEPRADALDRVLDGEREIADLLRGSLSLDWRRTRLASPVSRLIRINLGDAYEILAAHVTRHAAQLERARNRADFPAG